MSKGVPRIEKDAHIVVTCVQDWPEDGVAVCPVMQQFPGPRTFCMTGCNFSVADVGGPAAIDIRVIDLARADGKNVRWNDVEKMCKTRGVKTVPISWTGPGIQAPAELLDKAPYVAFRLVARGPWMLVRRPIRGGSIPALNLED